jgi:molybdate transport system substrate-binding protein
MRKISLLLVIALLLPTLARAQATEPVTVFAAASLTDVFKDLGGQWKARTGQDIRFSFAASGTLAKQIEQGAPAAIFASADEKWMDDLAQKKLIVPDTRVSPIGNTLVLIAPANQARPVTLERGTNLLSLLGSNGRIAVGEPSSVPAGIYAKQALTWMGQWDALRPRLASADSVRSALLLVERGEVPYGIVYGTDAAIDPGVKVVGTFPPASHDPVTYPFAVIKGADKNDPGNKSAIALLAFLAGHEAEATYKKFGFAPLVVN